MQIQEIHNEKPMETQRSEPQEVKQPEMPNMNTLSEEVKMERTEEKKEESKKDEKENEEGNEYVAVNKDEDDNTYTTF